MSRPAAVGAFALETDSGDRVVVRGGKVAGPGPVEMTVRVGRGELRPGLINAHDHLYLNHYPRLGAPPYANMYEWGNDIHSRFAGAVARCAVLPREDALLYGAVKNLVAGVTTVVHHDRWHPLLGESFPLRVARVRVAHSLGFESDFEGAVHGDDATRDRPLCMHLAEGVDDVAAGEVAEAERRGLLDRLLAVHLVGVSDEDVERLRVRDAAVVWCPTSSLHLYGATAPRALFDAGLDVLLGTDSLLSGDGTLLDELRAARALGYLSEGRLLDSVGRSAAVRLGIVEPRLAQGAPADLILLRRPLLEARPRDVGLVLVGGRPRYGDVEFEALFEACGVPFERLDVGGAPKRVVAPLGAVAARVRALTPEAARVLD